MRVCVYSWCFTLHWSFLVQIVWFLVPFWLLTWAFTFPIVAVILVYILLCVQFCFTIEEQFWELCLFVCFLLHMMRSSLFHYWVCLLLLTLSCCYIICQLFTECQSPRWSVIKIHDERHDKLRHMFEVLVLVGNLNYLGCLVKEAKR